MGGTLTSQTTRHAQRSCSDPVSSSQNAQHKNLRNVNHQQREIGYARAASGSLGLEVIGEFGVVSSQVQGARLSCGTHLLVRVLGNGLFKDRGARRGIVRFPTIQPYDLLEECCRDRGGRNRLPRVCRLVSGQQQASPTASRTAAVAECRQRWPCWVPRQIASAPKGSFRKFLSPCIVAAIIAISETERCAADEEPGHIPGEPLCERGHVVTVTDT